MGKKDKKEHGDRNSALSKELFEQKKYFDWVITTAFYAAIHYVEDKILPCKINNKECETISDVKTAYRMNGRHSSRERLVFENLPTTVAVRYKWLDDKSRYSRYTTFKVTSAEADKSQQYLRQIHEACYSKSS